MRQARIVVPGGAYHITHRGNRGQAVFFDDADRDYYRHWMQQDARRWGMDIWAYCLMRNHVHFVVTGHRRDTLAKVMGRSQSRYAQWINKRHGWSGHLWEGRFYSSLLDEAHFCNAVRYVELNPVRAGVVVDAAGYRWSSAPAHCAGSEDPLLCPSRGPVDALDWATWLREGLSDHQLDELRRNTATGRPSASDEFVRALERRLDRAIHRPSVKARQ